MKEILPRLHISLERWKYNPEFGIYVSTFGNFMDKNHNPIIPKINKNGYMKIVINDYHYFAHRVVLQTWKPIANYDDMTVDHLNHNKRDNRVCNLEWVSQRENLKRALADEIRDSEIDNLDIIMQATDYRVIACWLIQNEHMIDVKIENIIARIKNVVNKKKTYCGFRFVNYQGKIFVLNN